MAPVIYLSEGDGLPERADGFVVARNESGVRVMWCDAQSYVRTRAAPKRIVNGEWQIAIERAAAVARAKGRNVYVLRD